MAKEFFEQFKDTQFIVPTDDACVLLVKWGRKGVGFGELTLTWNYGGELHVDTEHMGPEFAKEILGALIDEAKEAGRLS